MAEVSPNMLPILSYLPQPRGSKRQPILPPRPIRLPKSETIRRRHLKPPLLFFQHSLFVLLILSTLIIQPTIAQKPYPFPALPQVFDSKSACRDVYEQCMQAFRDCLKSVGGNESGRLGCEAYRNDVCEGHIRVGCDQLPNGGGSIGPVPTDIPVQTGGDTGGGGPTSTEEDIIPSLTTFLTVQPITPPQTQTQTQAQGQTQTQTQTQTTRSPKLIISEETPIQSQALTNPTLGPTTSSEPESLPQPETSAQSADTTPVPAKSTSVPPPRPTATQQQQQPQPEPSLQSPLSTITLTSTAPKPPPTLATVAIVITTVVATTTDQAGVSQTRTWTTSMTVTRGLTFSSSSGATGIEWGRWRWAGVIAVGFVVHIGVFSL